MFEKPFMQFCSQMCEQDLQFYLVAEGHRMSYLGGGRRGCKNTLSKEKNNMLINI